MRPSLVLWFFLGCALLLPVALTIHSARQERAERAQLAQVESYDGQKSQRVQRVIKFLSLGADKRYDQARQEQIKVAAAVDLHRRAAVAWGSYLALSCCFFLLFSWVMTKKQRMQVDFFMLAVVWTCLLFLATGLLSPVFLFQKNVDYPLLGSLVYQFHMPSIPEAAFRVWETKPLIAILILLFSILTPLIKILLSIYLLIKKSLSARSGSVLAFISKWSMADVFIVAILLSVFSLSEGQGQIAEVAVGFYFFAGYCLLAHFQMLQLTRRLNRKTS